MKPLTINLSDFNAPDLDARFARFQSLQATYIDPAQSRARERTLSGAALVNGLRDAEERLAALSIPLKSRAGAIVTITPGKEKFSSSYARKAREVQWTAACFVRLAGKGKWQIKSILRAKGYPSNGVPASHLALLPSQEALAIQAFLASSTTI